MEILRNNELWLDPTKLHLINLILATGIVKLAKKLFVPLVGESAMDCLPLLRLCVIPIILKLHGWILSMHITKMDCASLLQISRSDNNASSYAKPNFLL
jgi:hypothetical protein